MLNNLFVSKKEKIALVFFVLLCLLCLLCFTSPLFASEPDSGFLGLGPGINGNTRHGTSYGGVLLLGVDINNQFSAGLKTSFFDNFDTVSANETVLFLRYYFPLPENVKGPFIQLEGGGVIFFERGYHKYLEAFPAFSGGLSVGCRFNLGNYMYIDTAGRVGYPHIWGTSVMLGVRFKNQKINSDEKKNKNDELSVAQIENNTQNDDNANQVESSVNQTDDSAYKKDSNVKIDININKINTNVNQNENKNTGRERIHEVH